MASNHSRTDGVKTVWDTLSQRMDSYDKLPKRLRQWIEDCPVEQSPTAIYNAWIESGRDTEYVLRIYNLGLQSKFPGYTPPRNRRAAAASRSSRPGVVSTS